MHIIHLCIFFFLLVCQLSVNSTDSIIDPLEGPGNKSCLLSGTGLTGGSLHQGSD